MRRHNLLVIDDDPAVHELIEFHLQSLTRELMYARDASTGMRLALERQPDVILLDVNLGDSDGFEVCRMLKANPDTTRIPILFLTVEAGGEEAALALDSGACDFVSKPFEPVELKARVRAALRSRFLLDEAERGTRGDGVTGLERAEQLSQALPGALAAGQFAGQPVHLLMLELVSFRALNPDLDWDELDEVLGSVADVIRSTIRPYDSAYRIRDAAFTLLLSGASIEQMELIAKSIVFEVEELPQRVGRSSLKLCCRTSRMGADSPAEAVQLLESAEAALR